MTRSRAKKNKWKVSKVHSNQTQRKGEKIMVRLEINLQTEVYLSDEVIKKIMTVFKNEELTVNTTIETLATIGISEHIVNNFNKFFK